MWTGEQFLLCMLHFNICAFLTAGILLWLRRESSGRARTYLAVICLFSGLAFLLRLIMYYAGFPVSSSVLPIGNLSGGFMALLLLYMYPIEVIHPGWLTWKRGMLLLTPWFVILLMQISFPDGFRELSSFGEMLRFAGEPNVWFRLLFLLLFVPYTVLMYVIPHNWMKSSVTHRWIYFYSSVILCIGVGYCSFMLTGLAVASVAHLLFCLVFCLLISYQELFLRIEVPAEAVPVSVPELKPVTEISPEETSADRPLWIRLNERMQEEKLWKNPNLTQDFLASLLDVSRPTLSTVIRENGFSGYKEYLNRCRIEEFLKIVNSNKRVGIRDAFFEVGYRSHATALQYFREYMGCTPTEYLNQRMKTGGN